MYYTISDVAARVNMSVSALRYYDYQGILSFVRKDSNGYRLFTEDDVADIIMIKELRACGIPLKEIKQFCDLYQKSGRSVQVQKKFLYAYEQSLLQKIRDDLDSLQVLQERIRTLDESTERSGGFVPLNTGSSVNADKNIAHIL